MKLVGQILKLNWLDLIVNWMKSLHQSCQVHPHTDDLLIISYNINACVLFTIMTQGLQIVIPTTKVA